MAVFVDDMWRYAMGTYRGMKMSHLIADTDEELHTMAKRIGMKKRWFQGDHYDVSLTMRAKAVKLGAIEITLRTCAVMAANKRAGWPMGDEKTCYDISKARVLHGRRLREFL
jgi:hypothetical protein